MKTDFIPITKSQWKVLNDSEISKILGCCSHTVMRERSRRGLPKVRKQGSGRPRKAGTYDLTLTIKQNAEILGVTVQRASQLKKELITQQENWI